ncbi:unnamed protein product [Microthlaspi erraticum]|uniref:CCHC-type domain-containing protein n=1 Tax=Microthlaspi erraticum TaxID=1685480 RepID=A0A6D2JHX2_9BRAS|nr:unnamed protein product [Microthlaspi erraticum]
MDGAPRGRGARGRGARGRGGRVGRGGRAGGRAGRGRGRGLPEESGESVAPSVHTASVTQSVPLAGDASTSVGLGAGAAPGGGGAPAPGRDDFADAAIGSFSAGGSTGGSRSTASGRGAACCCRRCAAGCCESGCDPLFGVYGPHAEDCCPMEYWVELAVHYLSGDAHLWWQAAVGRRAFWTWGDFLVEFNAKYFPRQARDCLQMRFIDIEQGSRSVREYDAEFSRLLVHAGFGMEAEHQLTNRFLEGLRKYIQTLCRSNTHTSRASLVDLAASVEADLGGPVVPVAVPGGLPAQGQKRSREEFSGASQFPRGSWFGCGSTEQRVSSCPKRESAPRVCYYCKEPGHIKPMCPKLQSMSVASVLAVAAQSVSQIAAVQPLGQIAPAPRGYSSVETGGTSQTVQITRTLLVGGFESHVLFDSGASNCFITPERAEKSGIRSSAGESAGMVKVAGGGFLSTLGRARGVEIEIAGQSMPADLVISPVELYDVILGMDWLSHYRVHLDCYRGRVSSSEMQGGWFIRE